MTNKLTLKSLTHSDMLVLIAPVLLVVSLFHIFDANPMTHKFGQLEILGALSICCYYLWDKISEIYEPQHILKQKIELVICITSGIVTALLLFAPLLTWQFFKLFRASNRYTYNRNILIAVLTLWAGCGIMFYSSYTLTLDRMNAANLNQSQFSTPLPLQGTP